MSVGTHLKGRNLSRYRSILQDEFKLLIAPALYSQASSITVDVADFLFWRSLTAAAEPLSDHFHSPACRH
ncbi:MAG TPA: hypothetical protein VFS30_07150 [Dehalococcoidia bacterium]|nr:hypothetical protein [Dehalococcoidia bacterium]